MALIDTLLQELEQEAQTTRRVLERVPDAHLGWKPHAKSMTLGQLAMHIALVPGGSPERRRRPSCGVASSTIAVQRERTGADARNLRQAGKGAGRSGLTARLRRRGGSRRRTASRAAGHTFLRSIMLNHWCHHRGQLSASASVNCRCRRSTGRALTRTFRSTGRLGAIVRRRAPLVANY